MTRTATGPWGTPGLTARLQALHADPAFYTAADMARILSKEFKIALTRNAIIGKSRRLLMAARKRPKVEPKPRIYVYKRRRPLPRPQLFADVQPRRDEPLTIYQLGAGDCKFPLGPYPYLYCGAEQAEGRPYCQTHYDLTHHKPRMTWE